MILDRDTNFGCIHRGAVKSNIGHLEGASALAGLIKAVLVLERGVIPPNTNFEKLNPKIEGESLGLKVNLIARDSGRDCRPRL